MIDQLGKLSESVQTVQSIEQLLPTDPTIRQRIVELSAYLSLDRISQLFEDTDAGRHLDKTVRFQGKYQPKDCSPDDFSQIIGIQANDLRHGNYTRNIGEVLLADEPRVTDPEWRNLERFLFGFTNETHDWGESNEKVGDIPFGQVKPYRYLEIRTHAQLANGILNQACDEQGIDVFDSGWEEAMNWVVNFASHVAFDEPLPPDKASSQTEGLQYYKHLYRATKYIGHFVVALRVGRFLDDPTESMLSSEELTDNLSRLQADVATNSLGVLIEYANIFAGVRAFLSCRRAEIDTALKVAARLFPGCTPNYNRELPMTHSELKYQWLAYVLTEEIKEMMAGRPTIS